MNRRNLLLYAIATVVALVCARLGFWQLERMRQQSAHNTLVTARMGAAPVEPSQLPGDSAARHFTRVRAVGTFEPSGEWVLANRGRSGSPGVNFLTPLRTDDGRVIIVNRGWAYAPDGSTVDRPRWRESGRAVVVGYVAEFADENEGPRDLADERLLRRARRSPFATAEPDIAPYYLVALEVLTEQTRSPGALADSTPVRLEPPTLDAGPHLSYAVQWFLFGAIAFGGAILLGRHQQRGAKSSHGGAPPLRDDGPTVA